MILKEAVKIHEKCNVDECDPDEVDCEKCLIGKEVLWCVTDGGVFIKATICSMILLLKDMLEQGEVS